MKKYFHFLRIMSFVLVAAGFIYSCGDDDVESGGANSQNKRLAGTKWTTTNWDYGVGDDWAGIFDETYNIYFYSQTEGVFYYGRKDLDSDFGSSSSRSVAHFTYNVEGSVVKLDYINNPMHFSSTLNFAGNTISMNGISFNKGTIGSSDNSWLNTLQGTTGYCKWYYDLSGSLYVRGDGDMADYTSFSNTPWGKNNRIPNYVGIQAGVTSIGSFAFANPSIGEVYIDSDAKLRKIGASAFSGTCISKISLPDEITVIGESAFSDCEYLSKVYMPSKIEEIGNYAFSGCKSASLALTKNLKRIGDMAFMGCDVTAWTDSPILKEIGTMALSNCSFEKLVLPKSIVSLGNFAFGGRISEIHIGTGQFTTTGIPFATTKSGKLYVNQNNPMVLTDNIVDVNNVRNWTLCVPSGSKYVYSKAEYWKNFGTIIEDSSLEGDGTEVKGDDDDGDSSSENIDEELDKLYATDSRRGRVASFFSGGSGTASDPYLISSAEELRYLSDAVRGGEVFKNKYIKLTSDITINRNVLNSHGELNGDGSNLEQWIPIGRDNPSFFFCGTFDGDGHAISGIYYNRPEGGCGGVFGRLFGTVKNVILKDSYFSGKSAIAGIAGHVSRSRNSSSIPTSLRDYYENSSVIARLINCQSYARICCEVNSGGIIGSASSTKEGTIQILRCANFGKLSGLRNCGGIVGIWSGGEITDSYNSGDIICDGGYHTNGGGLVGYAYASGGTIKNSMNRGCVRCMGKNGGGICAAFGGASSSMSNCVNIAEVSADQSCGSLVGVIDGKCTVKSNYYLFVSDMEGCGEKPFSNKYSGNSSMTEEELKSAEFITKLNKGAGSGRSKWKTGKDGFPILEWIEE